MSTDFIYIPMRGMFWDERYENFLFIPIREIIYHYVRRFEKILRDVAEKSFSVFPRECGLLRRFSIHSYERIDSQDISPVWDVPDDWRAGTAAIFDWYDANFQL